MIEHELACPTCRGTIELSGGIYGCGCGFESESLDGLALSGRKRDRQHEVGGFPSKPREFR